MLSCLQEQHVRKSWRHERTEGVPEWSGLGMARRKSVGVEWQGKGTQQGQSLYVPLPAACLSLPLTTDQQKLVVRCRWGAAGAGLG